MKNRFAVLFILLGFILLPGISPAQKSFTLEDCFLKVGTFAPSSLKQLGWIPGTEDFYWIEKQDGKDVLVKDNAKKSDKKNLLSLEELNVAIDNADLASTPGFPKINFTDATHFWFYHTSTFLICDLTAKKVAIVTNSTADGENQDFHSSGKIAFTERNELYVSMAGQVGFAVTSGNPDGIENGKSAHRNEFGIEKGTFWSPNGNLLAFYKVDETMVTTYPILDLNSLPAKSNLIRYPMAGDQSHHATIGVFDTRNKKTIWLKTGDSDAEFEQYLTNITFSPDEKNIYVAIINRGQNYLKLNQYDAASGEFLKTLFEEKSEKYIEPKHGLYFLPSSNTEFIWQSQRDGYNHLFHYKTDGTFLGQVTSGSWIVTDLMGFTADGKSIIFQSTNPSPVERQVWSVELATKKMKQLSAGAGTHTALMQDAGKYLLDNFTGSKITREISLVDGQGKILRSLLTSPDNLSGYKLGECRLFTIKANDGTDLWCRMILPPGFDASKKYPVIDYLYGGPGLQMVTDTWLGGAQLWMHYAAEKGYIVFTLDNRGSANRGLGFEQAVFRDFGKVEIEDQLKGVEYLKALPYVDGNRLGVYGWSFGGFLTTSLMLRSPETFKVAVAGGPVMDWRMYEVMYTERYMDTPQENPDGYANSNLLTKVKNLKGKLMLIHGTSDDVVLWQHSLNFIENSVKEGVQLDYFVYPGHLHNVSGKDRVHLFYKVLNFMMNNL